MEPLIQPLVTTGVSGIMLAFFIWYLTRRDADHKEERAEWKTSSDTHVSRFTEVVEKNTTALISMERTLERAECQYRHNK